MDFDKNTQMERGCDGFLSRFFLVEIRYIRWWHGLVRKASKVLRHLRITKPKAKGPDPLRYLRNVFRKFTKYIS